MSQLDNVIQASQLNLTNLSAVPWCPAMTPRHGLTVLSVRSQLAALSSQSLAWHPFAFNAVHSGQICISALP